jgi:hypothetical protein
MRLWNIREAEIDPALRETLEKYGVVGVQIALANGQSVFHDGKRVTFDEASAPVVLNWLTEEHDRAERRENWSLVLEIAIVLLIDAELLFLIWLAFVKHVWE